MAQEQKSTIYLLLDEAGNALAQVRPQGPAATEGTLWQLVVMNDKIDDVLEYKRFKLLSIEDSSPSYEGALVRHRNDIIQLEVRKTAAAGNDMRKNLRVPVEVNSFAYPLSGSWRGRRAVETHDLSCGGVAFFCDREFQVGEQFEVVIPVTSEPLVVKGQILRQRTVDGREDTLYAAKFIDLCNDEETILREAVFNLQLSGRPRRTAR